MNNYIEIDLVKCIGCGICVEECPNGVIQLSEKKACNVKPQSCISCGHCAALCPTGAIQSSATNTKHPFKIQPIDKSFSADKQLFSRKRSARLFTDKAIDKSELQKMIEYAEKAPSASNLRMRRYMVFAEPESVTELSACVLGAYKSILKIVNPFTLKIIRLFSKKAYNNLSHVVQSAQRLVDNCENGNDTLFRNSKCIVCYIAPTKKMFSADDCIAAQHYMMLYASTIHVDSVIIGFAQWAHKKIEKKYKIEKGYSIFAISAFGYGKHVYEKEIIYQLPDIQWN
jgi:ferredoxin